MLEKITEDPAKLNKAIAFAIGIIFLTLAYIWHKRTYSYWSSRGVKTPPIVPIFGNSLLYFLKPRKQLEVEFAKKYGRVYGYYSGSKPILVVADAQVAKKVCVSDFSNFQNHHRLGGLPNRYQANFLIMQKGDKWRRMRSAMSTTFTSSKMKKMYGIIDNCANDMLKSINERLPNEDVNNKSSNNEKFEPTRVEVNIQHFIRLYALDSISSCGYGFSMRRETAAEAEQKEHRRKKEAEQSKVKAITRDSMSDVIEIIFTISKFRFYANYILPHEFLKLFNLSLLRDEGMAYLAAKLSDMMTIRRDSGKKYNDYLQLLMYAQVDDEFDFSDMDAAENHHLGADTEELKKEHMDLIEQLRINQEKDGIKSNGFNTVDDKLATTLRGKMSDKEIICNAVMMLMVGTETTQALVSDLIYILAFHEDVQDKLYDELSKINKNRDNKHLDPQFDYEELATRPYLDAVISEAARMQPPVIYMDRMTEEDYFIEEYKIKVEKGTPVNISFYGIQNNEVYWPKPEVFDPERFMPQNRNNIAPGSYVAFGIGPRACIGMRFALAEMKVGLAKFILKFKLHPAKDAVYPARARITSFFQNQSYDLRVDVSQRF